MTQFAFPPHPQPSVAIAGSTDRFPVRRIFCVGRNYAAHAREMGKDPDREPPFCFAKPADAVVDSGARVPYPPQTHDLHHEIELVLAIGTGGADIAPDAVAGHLWGATVGNDLTRRDLQNAAKQLGQPWDMAKGFDNSAIIAPLVPISRVSSLAQGRIWLAVNGALRQEADLSDLIWPVGQLVAILSGLIRLERGDLVMTGTPAGVGPVVPGDLITGGIDGLAAISTLIAPPRSAAD